jgi:hypothetical protein
LRVSKCERERPDHCTITALSNYKVIIFDSTQLTVKLLDMVSKRLITKKADC